MGCGRVGSTLAKELEIAGHTVAIIDQDREAFRRLGADFKGQTVAGVGFDRDTLIDAGIEPKEFENLYKGFTQDLAETKENEEIYKKIKIILKKYFNEYETLHLKEFQVNLESIPSQLDGFLSI